MKYLLIVLSIAVRPGCADSKEESEVDYVTFQEPPAIELNEVEAEDMPIAGMMSFTPPPEKIETVSRKLIKTGSVNCEVSNVDSTRKNVENFVREMGGYISSDEQHSYEHGPQVDQVVRIPANKLDEFAARFIALAKKVASKEFSTEDVTEEFIDTEARLANKKDLEKRYRELLSHATKVTEMLEVEGQLEEVRSDIESMEGRLQYLTNQVTFSTLNISYYQVIPAVTTDFAFGSRLVDSLKQGWRSMLYFILNVFERWPFIIVGSGVVVIIFRWMRRRFLKPQPITNA